MMPGMTGIELMTHLRADPKTAGTTIIYYTANFDVALRDEAMALGAVACPLKGSDVEGFIKTITSWYERVGGVRAEQR